MAADRVVAEAAKLQEGLEGAEAKLEGNACGSVALLDDDKLGNEVTQELADRPGLYTTVAGATGVTIGPALRSSLSSPLTPKWHSRDPLAAVLAPVLVPPGVSSCMVIIEQSSPLEGSFLLF